MKKMVKKVERDRLNAYVEPATTKVIEEVKKEMYEQTGARFTIGQCVDYLARLYKKEKGK